LSDSPEELVGGGAAVHEGVGNHGGSVADGHAHSVLGRLQNQHVRVVGADEELQVQLDCHRPREDSRQLLETTLTLLFFAGLK
jgi:hypothetical protein